MTWLQVSDVCNCKQPKLESDVNLLAEAYVLDWKLHQFIITYAQSNKDFLRMSMYSMKKTTSIKFRWWSDSLQARHLLISTAPKEIEVLKSSDDSQAFPHNYDQGQIMELKYC